MESKNQKIVVITGCSSGIGLAAARVIAACGHRVYATSRNPNKMTHLKDIVDGNCHLEILEMDVTNPDSIEKAVEFVCDREGRLDVVVNNAGINIVGTLEMTKIEEFEGIIDVNLLGVVRVLQKILPLMRKQRSGHIINISSAVGVIGLPGFDAYIASKFALEGLSESLWFALRPFNINVSIVEPGPVGTDFFEKSRSATRLDPNSNPYSEFMERIKKTYYLRLYKKSQTPDEVAGVILRPITDKRPRLRYQTSGFVKRAVRAVRKNHKGDGHLRRYARMIGLI